MTWKKATLVLAICVIFDALRLFFTSFWFFGPAIAAIYCTSKVSGWIGSMWGLTAAACTAASGTIGYFAAPAIAIFGTIMAMAFGLLGWLTVGLIILMTNSRISLSDNLLLFIGGLLTSETPIIGALPALTGTIAKMYSAQIKKDKETLKKYEKEQTDSQIQERNQRAAYLMQENSMRQEQEEQQEQEIEQEEEEQEAEQEVENEAEPTTRGNGNPSDSSDIQFETLQDALSELNSKENRTLEETAKLNRAREIMEGQSILVSEKNDPVLMAASNRYDMGQRAFDGTAETRNGFHFSNIHFLGTMVQ